MNQLNHKKDVICIKTVHTKWCANGLKPTHRQI